MSKWCKQSFRIYDDMAELTDGIVATGAGAFHPGRDFAELDTQFVADDSDQEVVLDLRTHTQSSLLQTLSGANSSFSSVNSGLQDDKQSLDENSVSQLNLFYFLSFYYHT